MLSLPWENFISLSIWCLAWLVACDTSPCGKVMFLPIMLEVVKGLYLANQCVISE